MIVEVQGMGFRTRVRLPPGPLKKAAPNLVTGSELLHFYNGDELPFDQELDVAGNYVSTEFIDTHVHGGDGYEFIDATEEAVTNAVNIHALHVTTTIYLRFPS